MGKCEDTPDACRLCGSKRLELWGMKPGKRFKDRLFSFQRCRDCDFRFVHPVTGPEIYDDDYYAGRGVDPLVHYEAEYEDYASTPRIEEFRGLVQLVEEHFARTGHLESQPPLIRWLDFGCGAGGLLKYLRDRASLDVAGTTAAIDVSGFDMGAYVGRLRERDGLQVYTEEELRALSDGAFDVVSLIEVIEHMERPADVLAQCSRLLRPEGLLLLTTGNLACPLARWQGIHFGYCIPEIHISLWTPRSLERGYARVGLIPQLFRCDGSIRFKIAKNLARVDRLEALGPVWYSPPVRRVLDWLFGVSKMPMAVKPAARM